MAIRLSHTQLSMWEECELKWYKGYVERVQVARDPTHFIVGSAWHNALEHWLKSGVFIKDPASARGVLRDLVQKYLDAELQPYPLLDFPQEWVDDALKIVDTVVDALKEHRLLSRKMLIEPEYIPKPFGCGVYVKPDLVTFRTPDYVVVTDFKSSKDDRWIKKSQLELYAFGLRYEKKLPVREAGFLMLRTGKWVAVEVADEEAIREKVKRRITSAFLRCSSLHDGIRKPQPSPGSACAYCDYRRKCEFAPDGAPVSI